MENDVTDGTHGEFETHPLGTHQRIAKLEAQLLAVAKREAEAQHRHDEKSAELEAKVVDQGALIARTIEMCAKKAELRITGNGEHHEEDIEAQAIAAEIRALIPDNARAALEAMKVQARSEGHVSGLKEASTAAVGACESRADILDEMGLEVECCVATAKNCAADAYQAIQEMSND